jgi:hypothetical protein
MKTGNRWKRTDEKQLTIATYLDSFKVQQTTLNVSLHLSDIYIYIYIYCDMQAVGLTGQQRKNVFLGNS